MKNKAQTAFFTVVILGLALAAVVYLYVFKAYNEKTDALVSSNRQLATRVEELRVFYEKMPEYKEQIALMTDDIQKRLGEFPADVKEEDVIYLALRTWEEGILAAYSNITVAEREEMALIPAETVQAAGIEGLDKEIGFRQRMATYTNTTTYSNMKDLIESINRNQEQLAITSVAYSVNDEKLLEGSIDVTFYMVSGTGKEYVPRTFKDYPVGISNLFGGVQ